MSDMRPGWLLQADDAPHNDCTLSFRVTHLSPSSSGADVQ
jgi:hypothetical protein